MAADLPVRTEGLRPLERRLLRLAEAGFDDHDLARRFRRSPEHIRRVLELAQLPGRAASAGDQPLRPLERRILRWREQGATWTELSERFKRSHAGLVQIERLAQYKLAR